ncbi:hypothetical protein, partial [Neisseria meningitidis]|uniref:hypothetical protein n=1 Tax=Neisseria meningitidis TaxID=487 RepID=UPI001C9A0AAB
MGKHQYGGIKRGMGGKLPFSSFFYFFFLWVSFTGRGGGPRNPGVGKTPPFPPPGLLVEKPFHLAAKRGWLKKESAPFK